MKPAWRQATLLWLALLALACQLIVPILHGPHSHVEGKPAVSQALHAPAADWSAPPDPAENDRECELCAMMAAAGLVVLTLAAALVLAVQFSTSIAHCFTTLAQPQDGDWRPRARAPPSPAVT